MWLLVVLLSLLPLSIISASADNCSTCKDVINEFLKGLERTAGKSFSGGNSLWEEKNLVNYAFSETRFHSIIDGICEKAQKSFQCHKILHEVEPLLDDWWENVFRADSNQTVELENEICVLRARMCCPVNTYGKDCTPCKPCSISGGSCNGNGTRSGDGTCICKSGYAGTLCDACDLTKYFQLNVTFDGQLACQPCHKSCDGGCRGPEASDCEICANGWYPKSSEDGSFVCTDVDECKQGPCKTTEYCENLEGSYSCIRCPIECNGCTGPTAADCMNCAPGFAKSDGKCEDINECESSTSPCTLPGEICRNTKGGYRCDCKTNWSRVKGMCMPNDAAGKYGKKSEARTSKNEKYSRIIWTVSFTKEMGKYLGSLCAFVVLCWLAKGHPFVILLAGFILSLYIYNQSIQLDLIFKNQL